MTEHAENRPRGPAVDDPSARELLRGGLSALRKHIVLAVGVGCLVVATGAAVSIFQPREYTASARILVHPRAPKVLDRVEDVMDDDPIRSPAAVELFLNTQQDIIRGLGVAQKAVAELGLATDPDWVGPTTDEATGAPIPEAELERRAVERVIRQTTLKPSPRSQIIDILVADSDPLRAAEIANKLAESYRKYSLDLRVELSRESSEWLEQQVATQQAELDESERAIQDFMVRNGLQALSISAWQNLTAEKATELSAALTEVEQERLRLEATNESLKQWIADGKDPIAHPALSGEPGLPELRAALQAVERQLAKQTDVYGERWPEIGKALQERNALQRQLDETVAGAVAAVEERLQRQRAEEAKLQGALDAASVEARDLGGLEFEFNRLKRVAATNARLTDDVVRRLKETRMAQQTTASTVNILDPATPPQRFSSPNLAVNAAASLLLAVVLALLATLLAEALDSRIDDVGELEQAIRAAPIGIVPVVADNDVLFVNSRSYSNAAESIRAVRTHIAFQGTTRKLRRILVTSAVPREGKTTIACNVAATMALAGQRVLLIDADLRRPRVHKLLGISASPGLMDALVGDCAIEEAIRPSEVAGLFVLSCGDPPPNPAEVVSGDAFRALLDKLGKEFDYVVLDSPPTLPVTDSTILSQICDGVIVVVRLGYTERRPLREMLKTLASVHAPMLGVVVNGLRADSERGAYSYRYGYSAGYESHGPTSGEGGRGRRARPTTGVDA